MTATLILWGEAGSKSSNSDLDLWCDHLQRGVDLYMAWPWFKGRSGTKLIQSSQTCFCL